MFDTSAVILAGGLGVRIRHLSGNRPKPMVPVLGRPFLEWVIRFVAAQSVNEIVISTGYRSEVIQRYVRGHALKGVTVTCIAEPGPQGTAGGFRLAAERSGLRPEFWLVLNGDSLVITSLAPLREALAGPEWAGALLGVNVQDTSRYGTLHCHPNGELRAFGEKQPGAGVISGGIYLLRSSLLQQFPATSPLSFERDVFPLLTSRRVRLKVCPCTAPFLDIGTPETLAQAESFIREHEHQLRTV